MKKIEPVAWRQSEGVITEDRGRADSWSRFGWTCQSLWTDDALQAVAEAVRDACQEEVCRGVCIDIPAIINQLKGE